MRALLVIAAAVGLSGCLWDPDFFDTYSEAGADEPTMDVGVGGGAGGGSSGGQVDAAPPPPPTSGLGPDCEAGTCGLVTVVGSLQVAGVASDEGGGCWVLVNGPVEAAYDAGGQHTLDPSAPGHLLHISSAGFGVDQIIPLPFVGTGLEASRTATFVSGYRAQAGEILGTPIDPAGRGAIVARIAGGGLQWWVSWSSNEPPLLGSEGPAGVWVLGSPANADLHAGDAADPFHSGSDPAAPHWFMARFDGLGNLDWLNGFGTNQMVVDGFSVGTGGHGTFAVRGRGTLWDGTMSDNQTLTVAQANAQGGILWTTGLLKDQIRIQQLSVEPGGATWAAVQGDNTAEALAMVDPPIDGTLMALRMLPNGTIGAGTALTGTQRGSLDAIDARAGGNAVLVGQTYAGGVTALGGMEIEGSGAVLGSLNGQARGTWLARFGDATPNAPLGRFIDSAPGFHCLAMDGSAEWGGQTSFSDGRPTVVVLGFPTPR